MNTKKHVKNTLKSLFSFLTLVDDNGYIDSDNEYCLPKRVATKDCQGWSRDTQRHLQMVAL